MATEWQKIKNSGAFKRKIKKNYLETLKLIIKPANISNAANETKPEEVRQMDTSWPFLEVPIKSTHLKIFKSDNRANAVKKLSVSDIKCKMVAVPLVDSSSNVFIPLYHTLKCNKK